MHFCSFSFSSLQVYPYNFLNFFLLLQKTVNRFDKIQTFFFFPDYQHLMEETVHIKDAECLVTRSSWEQATLS